MRKSRFSESQIVGILKEGEGGVPIAEILRQHNISKATYFYWRSKYAGASVDELKLNRLVMRPMKFSQMRFHGSNSSCGRSKFGTAHAKRNGASQSNCGTGVAPTSEPPARKP